MDLGMKRKPITSGKERELQQACTDHKSVKQTWSTDVMMQKICSIRHGWLSSPLEKKKRKNTSILPPASQHEKYGIAKIVLEEYFSLFKKILGKYFEMGLLRVEIGMKGAANN